MLILFWFNMDSIRSTNFLMNRLSDPIMPFFIVFLSKCGTFTYNVVNFSSVLLHILHVVPSFDLSVFHLIIIVRMACSWATNIKLSVSRFRVPFCNYCHLSWFPTSLVCCTNWPCNIFLTQEITLCFFFCFLVSIIVSRIGSIKSISTDLAAVIERTFELFYIVL